MHHLLTISSHELFEEAIEIFWSFQHVGEFMEMEV